MMMMMTTNPEYIVTDDLGLAKSSVAVSSAHHHLYHLKMKIFIIISIDIITHQSHISQVSANDHSVSE